MFKLGYFQLTNCKFPIFALILGVLLCLSGCRSKSVDLQTLENSISILQLSKGREVNRSVHDKGWVLPQPFGQTQPKVSIEYEPINPYTREDVCAEIVAILKKNHWEGGELGKGRNCFDAYLPQGSFEMSAGVIITLEGNFVVVNANIWPSSAELQTLEKAVSILQITTGREVDRYVTDKGGISPALPVFPEISISFEPSNEHTKEDVYNEIIAILERNDWQMNESDAFPGYFDGFLQQGRFKISGDVYPVGRDINLVRISMTIH
jgi:hypothetical protein